MVTLIGLVLLAIAISLCVLWWSALLAVMQGLLVLFLMALGGVLFLVGYSELKATREYNQGLQNDGSTVPGAEKVE